MDLLAGYLIVRFTYWQLLSTLTLSCLVWALGRPYDRRVPGSPRAFKVLTIIVVVAFVVDFFNVATCACN